MGSGPQLGPDGGGGGYADAANGTELWTGYIERFAFLSGSDRVTVKLTSPTTGIVVFGDATAPPPPLDPAVGYPPGYGDSESRADRLSLARFAERLPLTMVEVSRDIDRMRFSIDLNEVVAPWCRGQKLIVINHVMSANGVDIPMYECAGVAPVPESDCASVLPLADGGIPPDVLDGGTENSPSMVSVDCSALRACMSSCICTFASCDRGRPNLIDFDLHVVASEADGNISLGKLRLTRQ